MKHLLLFSALPACLLSGLSSFAQFAPAAGQPGTSAMFKDSSAFTGWATACHLIRGPQDISAPSGPYASVGDSTAACGPAGTTGVVSLGDGGIAILRFSAPIQNVAGPDLSVFENGFDDTFLELAFVEVSSDGQNYFRFPAVSQTDTSVQTGSFGLTDPTQIHNLAGKYRANYGTPFDLADIPDDPLLNKQAITHVRIVDVVGSMQPAYCTRDKNNRKVNDPWPTAFGSGGFDLDAVGVIHQPGSTTALPESAQVLAADIYPNPASSVLHIQVKAHRTYELLLTNFLGETLRYEHDTDSLFVGDLPGGIYTLSITAGEKRLVQKIVIATGIQ